MTPYRVYRLTPDQGAPLSSLPPDSTERPAWIDVISQRLRAGHYLPLGVLSLCDGRSDADLPAMPGTLYVNETSGEVLACPGGTVQSIGSLTGLLGYPELIGLDPDRMIALDTVPEGLGPSILYAAACKPGRAAANDLLAIFMHVLRLLPRSKSGANEALTIDRIFSSIRPLDA